jgi:cyclic 2,3-diphosphoglycerate synthetase
VIALIDGEHHPGVVRSALERLDSEHEVVGVLFAGGEEKVAPAVLGDPAAHYGREVTIPGGDLSDELRSLAERTGPGAVVDLSGVPVLGPDARLALAAVALHLGLGYRAPGLDLNPPPTADIDTGGVPVVAVIGTGKRTGKTALGTHLAMLLRDAGREPVVVSMGRGGPARPVLVRASERPGVERLLEIARGGGHAASDYLEDAVLAGVTTVGCRRCGEGPAGETYESNVADGVLVALGERPGIVVFEGSGAAQPPVAAHATVCVTSALAPSQALSHLGPLRLLRSDLLVMVGAGDLSATARAGFLDDLARWVPRERIVACDLRPEPAEPLPAGARIACFVTARPEAEQRLREQLAGLGLNVRVYSSNLARRAALEQDVARAVEEGCDMFLTELKAAAIDVVAESAARHGIRVAFLRNRPVEIEGEQRLDDALLELCERALVQA